MVETIELDLDGQTHLSLPIPITRLTSLVMFVIAGAGHTQESVPDRVRATSLVVSRVGLGHSQ